MLACLSALRKLHGMMENDDPLMVENISVPGEE